MTEAPASGAVSFNPLDPSFIGSPFAQYATLRDTEPRHHSELLSAWIVTRYDDVDRILRDPSMSSDIGRATPTPITQLELDGLAEHSSASSTIVHMDDPDYGRVRRLMAEPFRVRQIGRLASLIETRVDDALDHLRAEHGEGPITIDLIADVAYPLPVEIFSTWLGVPSEAHPQFRRWTSWVARSRDPLTPEEREELYAAMDAMYDYLADQVEVKRRTPSDDLLSYLVRVEHDEARLSHDELMSQLITLYMAGHEPTAGLIGNGALGLLRHPDQLARLRAEPDLVRNAVAELLRYDGPNQFVRRIPPARPLSTGPSCPPARSSTSVWHRPTATRVGGDRRPTR